MKWKNLKISKKLAIGFGSMLVLVIVAGTVGYSGIQTVGHSLFVVGNEEAPLVDMAMEMKVTLMTARNAMEEFKSASAAIATDNESDLEAIEARFNQTLEDFDKYTKAILEGAELDDGTVVIKTDNTGLASMVQEAGAVHDSKFQTAAKRMMSDGRDLLAKKARWIYNERLTCVFPPGNRPNF